MHRAPSPPNPAPVCPNAALQPTATFTGLKVCGKTWTFVLKAKNGAGLWSGDSAPTEPYAAAPCPLRCLPKSATCQPAGRRRLFGALECCNSLKCVATQPPTKTVPPFVCASKPSAPLDIIVTPDQSNANTVVIQLQPPQDAGAQGIGERMGEGHRRVGPGRISALHVVAGTSGGKLTTHRPAPWRPSADLNSLTYEVVGKATDGTKVTQTVYAVSS